MKWYNFSVFLFVLGLMFNDYWLVKYISGGMKQSFFFIPILVLYFLKPSVPRNSSVRVLLLGYIIILGIQVLLAAGTGIVTAYSYIGNLIIVLVLSTVSLNYDKIIINIKYYLIALLLVVGGYYLGYWDFQQFYGRGGMFSDNPNNTAIQLVIGFACSLFMVFRDTNRIDYKYLIYSGLMILPMVDTGSRAGVLAMTIVAVSFSYILYKRLFRVFVIVLIVVGFVKLTPAGLLFKNEQRTTNTYRLTKTRDHDREFLWGNALNAIENNLILGVGLDNYNDNGWRIQNGFYLEDTSVGEDEIGSLTPASVHQSFLEMAMVGGIFFTLVYISMFVYLGLKSYVFIISKDPELQVAANLILALVFIMVIFSYTAQASINKLCWWSMGVCYMFIHNQKLKYIEELKERYYARIEAMKANFNPDTWRKQMYPPLDVFKEKPKNNTRN